MLIPAVTNLAILTGYNVKTIESPLRNFITLISVLILSVIILVQNMLPGKILPPVVFLVAFLIIMATNRLKVGFLKLAWPLILVLLLGIIGLKDNDTFDIVRDIAYALTPIALIYIGYWMADNKISWVLVLKVIVSCGVAMAIIHLLRFAQNPELLSADLRAIRSEAGGTGGLVVLSLILCVLQFRLGVDKLFPRFFPRIVALPILLTSFVLSYSRTSFVVALIFSLALVGALSQVRLRSILILFLVVIGFVAMVATAPEGDNKTFRGKLSRSATEIAIDETMDFKDINANWRGFETSRVLDTFIKGNMLQQIVGQGAGALVDIGFVMNLEGEDFRYLPLFHNGYAYVLLKTGLIGFGCYIFFYLSTVRTAVRGGNSHDREQVFLSRLLLGCVLSLAATMFVVGGMAEIHDAEFVLLTGYLVKRTLRADQGRISSKKGKPVIRTPQDPCAAS